MLKIKVNQLSLKLCKYYTRKSDECKNIKPANRFAQYLNMVIMSGSLWCRVKQQKTPWIQVWIMIQEIGIEPRDRTTQNANSLKHWPMANRVRRRSVTFTIVSSIDYTRYVSATAAKLLLLNPWCVDDVGEEQSAREPLSDGDETEWWWWSVSPGNWPGVSPGNWPGCSCSPPTHGCRFCRAFRDELWMQRGSAVGVGSWRFFIMTSCCSVNMNLAAACRSASRSSAVCRL